MASKKVKPEAFRSFAFGTMERISSDAEDGLSSSQDGAKKRRRNGNATHLGGKRANTGIKNNLRRLQAPPGNGKTDGVAGAAKKKHLG